MAVRTARRDVPMEQTWDLEGLYPTTAAWEADLARTDSMLPGVAAYQGRLGNGAADLLACLTKADQVRESLARVVWYAVNSVAVDQGDPQRQALRDKANALQARVSGALAFIKPEILALPDGKVAEFVEVEPNLAPYRLYLSDILAEKEHMLSTEGEQVLAAMTELMSAPYEIWQNTTAADIKFDPVIDEHGNEVPMSVAAGFRLLQSQDRRVREDAYRSSLKAFGAHKRTIAASFAAAQKRDVIVAKLRKYPSALAAALAPSHLPESLFHNLLRVVEEQGTPHLRRYMRFRKQELKLAELQPWDLSVPLDPNLDSDITFRDACGMILEALAPMGPEYRAVLEEALANRWVDWADNEGKEAGAYSWGCYGYHPVILMTWQGKIADAFTLAHELGHTVHSVLSCRNQPFQYSYYGLFLAEMASTTNEILLARHLLKTTTNRALKRYVLTRAISSFTANFYGGTMMAATQLKAHEMVEQGQPLTYESITELHVDVSRRYYGDTMVIKDEESSNWLRVAHNFLNFYSYQYATGITAAAAFADAILTEGEPAVQRYLNFLRAGSSAHPLDTLKAAGVDLTTPAPIEKAAALFGQLVTELEQA